MLAMAAHCGLDRDAFDVLLVAVQGYPDTPIQSLSMATPEEVEQLLASLTIPRADPITGHLGNQPLSRIQKSAIRQMFSSSNWMTTPVAPTPQLAQAPPAAQPKHNLVGQIVAMTTTAATQLVHPVGHSIVLAQESDLASEQITTDEHINYVNAWKKQYGKNVKIPKEEEPTADQLSALRGCLASGQVPYADFCIFIPHATRFQKVRHLMGKRLNTDNIWVDVAIDGPADLEVWLRGWRLFNTCMIMLGAVDLGTLKAYHDLIVRLHREYTSASWPYLYQADVRARNEQLQGAPPRNVT